MGYSHAAKLGSVDVLKLTIVIAALFLPAAALAQTAAGPYVSGEIGAGLLDGSLRSVQGTTKIGVDDGPSGAVAVGWRFGDGLRAELQEGDQSNSVTSIFTRRLDGNLHPLGGPGGALTSYSMMANVLYDVPKRYFVGPLQPYVGIGAGYGWLDLSGAGGAGAGVFHLPQNNTYTGPDRVNFGAGAAFAYQLIVGASLPIKSLPGLKLTAEYRFLGTARADVPVSRVATGGDTVNGVLPSAYTHNGFILADNVLAVGLRYNFGSR